MRVALLLTYCMEPCYNSRQHLRNVSGKWTACRSPETLYTSDSGVRGRLSACVGLPFIRNELSIQEILDIAGCKETRRIRTRQSSPTAAQGLIQRDDRHTTLSRSMQDRLATWAALYTDLCLNTLSSANPSTHRLAPELTQIVLQELFSKSL